MPRLDELMVRRGLASTRERAQALVAAGLVEVDGVRAASAGAPVPARAAVRVTGRSRPWVSRGGLKLDPALDALALECRSRVCLDAGASTGGFTDVLLARGARLVYAVDVGRGLLHPRLASDRRVRVLDRTNLRTLETLGGPAPTLVTLDLSFISLRVVLPSVARLAPGADVVALFKPQFEVARADVGPEGIVRDPEAVRAALAAFASWAEQQLGARSRADPVAAGIRGAKGNQEWFVHLRLGGAAG